jgi:hypothetical protein
MSLAIAALVEALKGQARECAAMREVPDPESVWEDYLTEEAAEVLTRLGVLSDEGGVVLTYAELDALLSDEVVTLDRNSGLRVRWDGGSLFIDTGDHVTGVLQLEPGPVLEKLAEVIDFVREQSQKFSLENK